MAKSGDIHKRQISQIRWHCLMSSGLCFTRVLCRVFEEQKLPRPPPPPPKKYIYIVIITVHKQLYRKNHSDATTRSVHMN